MRPVIDILLLLVVAAVFRGCGLESESVWLDDYFSAAFLDAPGLSDFLSNQRHENWEMVPVYYSMQYFWARTAPTDMAWVRLLSVLFGLGAVAAVYIVGRCSFGVYAGRLGALCVALSPYQVFHSQGLRPYALMVPLALISCWMLFKWANDGRRGAFGFHYACNFLLVWTHLLTPVLFVAQGAALLCLGPRRRALFFWTGLQLFLVLQAFLWTTTIEAAPDPEVPRPALGAPWTLLTDRHADYRGDFFGKIFMNEGEYLRWVIGFPPKHFDAPLPEMARMLVDARQPLELALARLLLLAVGVFCVFGLAVYAWSASVRRDRSRRALLFWFICGLAPVLTLFVLAQLWKAHIFQSRYILYAWPCLYLACAGVMGAACGRWGRVAYAVAVAVVMVPLALLQFWLPVRTDYISAGRLIASESIDSVVLCHDYNVGRLLAFNMPGTPPHWAHVPDEEALFARLDAELENGRDIWLVFAGNESADMRRRLCGHLLSTQMNDKRHTFLGMRNLYVYRVFPREWNGSHGPGVAGARPGPHHGVSMRSSRYGTNASAITDAFVSMAPRCM